MAEKTWQQEQTLRRKLSKDPAVEQVLANYVQSWKEREKFQEKNTKQKNQNNNLLKVNGEKGWSYSRTDKQTEA